MRERGLVASPRELILPVVALAMVASGAYGDLSGAVAVPMIAIGAGMFFVGMLLPSLTEFQIGPAGFSAKLRERDQEVRATLEPESESLLHAATTLAGSPEAGRELLDRALLETYLQWRKAKQEGPVEAVVRRLEDLAPADARAPAATPGEAR